MKELILATGNAGKIAELQSLLAPIHCITQQSLGIDDAEETGLSFIENAILKARHAAAESHKPALADDSGLVVPILDGQPGIYSARFAGPHAGSEDNIALLLEKLQGIPEKQRGAYFYCAIALVKHAKDPTPLIATGKFFGFITLEPKGRQGFGYDPVFYVPQYQCTVAELPAKIKNEISHRALALRSLLANLGDI
ncbi:RdgB/HAM1 family non-canonical purine NTP pyrophosphatase [Legionella septentrionalis]|uniref:dITP/XTP pyrophosphatase n=1 Tax=Legionella septentrionalis TaxID=2498109 RepID=A0A3S0VA22_9GAMM|nr:RdgB/HAM1 family non-canonical purine NTP pyrophosphatase [Legionella septentrionalis]RUQ84448.1 RdgB/HAM1 family non-canonical purine NTP pyrophosphatase [Legionella septentrionalis]RUQ94650.1 RdgB/HAM1 family non-canonical purine NTP pyrophosphatase [Legionella septentrionalis]RUR14481.1 RdgB/HAM1 family non-canonical purine NTP pyrophosphatase [Legionella septentrionalis]